MLNDGRGLLDDRLTAVTFRCRKEEAAIAKQDATEDGSLTVIRSRAEAVVDLVNLRNEGPWSG